MATETRRTGLVYDPIFLEHDAGWGHPERRQRLEGIVERLTGSGLLDELERIDVEPAAVRWIESVHDAGYAELVERICRNTSHTVDLPTGDAPVGPRSHDVALRAVGGVLRACDAVAKGRVRNAFCAVRPPGHHSRPKGGMGFCVFNNVAIAARYLQQRHGLQRIAILDWDVHHGNGTQDTFYEDPDVLFCSTHVWPFYPGSGLATETGAGDGIGSTVNIPLDYGMGNDEIIDAFDRVFRAEVEAFQPDALLLSAGYDAHAEDPLVGLLKVDDEGFRRLATIVRELADEHCQGRLLATLEGGYGIDVLARCVCDTIRIFHD